MAIMVLKEQVMLKFISVAVASLFCLNLFISMRLQETLPKSSFDPADKFLHSNTIFENVGGNEKHLEYFVQAGWSNQVVCLKHAYEIALATGRGLVLSPVVPHFASLCTMSWTWILENSNSDTI